LATRAYRTPVDPIGLARYAGALTQATRHWLRDRHHPMAERESRQAKHSLWAHLVRSGAATT
jgi:hypothetical protein